MQNYKISIAMATFEGRKFIEKQFESLLQQTRLPDEIIIYDDASSDDTVSILKDLKKRAPFRVEIIQGSKNLGVNTAFFTALAACNGTYIFFCDQDDVWEPKKIEMIVATFDSNPNIAVVFSNASQINENNITLQMSLWEQIKFNKKKIQNFEHNPLDQLLKGGNFIYGMSAAFRLESIKHFSSIIKQDIGMTHDTWYALHVIGVGWKGVALDEKLVCYRRHDLQNTSVNININKVEGIQARKEARRTQNFMLIKALEVVMNNVSNATYVRSRKCKLETVRQISLKIQHLTLREKLRDSRNPLLGLRALVSKGYWQFAKGPVSVLRDLWGL